MEKNFLKDAYKKSIKKMSHGHGLGKKPVIKKILKNIEKNLKTDFTEIQGSKMFLDPGDSLDLSINGVYGELDTRIVRDQIKEGDIVIDVGANIGYYTLILAQLVGKNGRVFAFEPEPKNFEILKKNVEINNYDNVVLEQKIVSDYSGKMKLYVSEGDIVAHRINQEKNLTKTIEVESITLDSYMEKLNLENKINFIKIDVEGAEPKVLDGSNKIISQSPNLIIFTEFNRKDIVTYDKDPADTLNFLHQNKFQFFLPDYKSNTLNHCKQEYILTSEEVLKENLNILCKKQDS